MVHLPHIFTIEQSMVSLNVKPLLIVNSHPGYNGRGHDKRNILPPLDSRVWVSGNKNTQKLLPIDGQVIKQRIPNMEQFVISGAKCLSDIQQTDTQPEYICYFTNPCPRKPKKRRSRKHINSKSDSLRVKSMEEHILEQSLRRNRRQNTEMPDLQINGGNAPGYKWKWEKLKHLPDLKHVQLQKSEPGFNWNQYNRNNKSYMDDLDSSFAQHRVDEILRDEGVMSPDSGVEDLVTSRVHFIMKSQPSHPYTEHRNKERNPTEHKGAPPTSPVSETMTIFKTKRKLPSISMNMFERSSRSSTGKSSW